MMINFNPRLPLKDGCLPIALKDADPRYHKGMPRPAPKKGKKWATALMWALVAGKHGGAPPERMPFGAR